MVLKKPYAFIIKHFRIIHLICLLPMIYLIIKTRGIVSFFSDYVANNYALSGNVALGNLSASYINIFMYVAVILILAIFITLAFILQYKNKPTKFYSFAIIYYIAMFIFITLGLTIFQKIEADTLDNTLARIIRDFIFLVHYSQYFFVIFTAIRGIGFNIKKFDFKGDIENLEISSEDSEEFEFLVGKDNYKTQRTIRRFLRELVYYYKENKFIFTLIVVIIIVIIGSSLYTNRTVYQKEYKINDNVAFGYLNFKVQNAYITDTDLSGSKIKNGKKYLIILAQVTNRYRDDYILSYGNVQLVINKLRLSPNLNVVNNFTDLGRPFLGTLIKGNTSINYIFAYEMDENLVTKNYTIETYSGYDTTPGGIGAIRRKIVINPTYLSKNNVSDVIGLNSKISLNSPQLGKSEVTIKDYEVTNRFSYIKNGVRQDIYIDIAKDYGKTLMILDYSLVLDDEAPYMDVTKTYKSFFEDFLIIKYTYNGKEYQEKVKLINPSGYSDKLIFKVSKYVADASDIQAVISLRNKDYSVRLK